MTISVYNPDWINWYLRIESTIRGALGDLVIDIHHVGSTSVLGLCAKPVIDIDVVINEVNLHTVIGMLEDIKYNYEGDLGIIGRYAFSNSVQDLPPHHLYVCDINNPELGRHLILRDFLRNNMAARSRYAKKKRELVALSDDRQRYIEGKDELVKQLLEEALQVTDVR